jgi:hypothetical protein
MKKGALFLFLLPTLCFSLEEKPWFGEVLELHFIPQYNYNFFDKIDRAKPQLKSPFHTHVLNLGFDVTVPETWNWEMELEFADTTRIDWHYRSFAFQVRKLWLDDVAGDCMSLSSGFVYRDASNRMRKAFSTPYHARANFELHTAFGKEWCSSHHWIFRTFGFAAIGQGSAGAPWLRGDLFLMGRLCNCHELRAYAQSYFGLGSKETVRTRHFHGWANLAHKSVDLGVSYGYYFERYGNFRLDYLYRLFARSYPEGIHSFTFTYDFPFSVF